MDSLNPPVRFDVSFVQHHLKLDINHICDIHPLSTTDRWYYYNINHQLMFSDHRSWIYFITVDSEIVKIGETEQPLGILPKARGCLGPDNSMQPISGSTNRLGRYATMKTASNSPRIDTDEFVREELDNDVKSNKVAFWAFQSQILIRQAGIFLVESAAHKRLEKLLITKFIEVTGTIPRCNKGNA